MSRRPIVPQTVSMFSPPPKVSVPAIECKVPRCGSVTKGGKPYCTRHLFRNPEARRVLDGWKRRTREEQLVAFREGAILLDDALVYLRFHGVATVERLSRELNVSLAAAGRVAAALVRRGQARAINVGRGFAAVELKADA